MRIAVSSTGTDLDSQIDPRFGRCAYFLIVETDDLNFEAFKNASVTLGGGAGIQSAQFIASKGATAVITGRCGPNAVQALSAAGLDVYLDHAGIIKDVLKKFSEGNFTPTLQPNAAEHSGMRDQPPSGPRPGLLAGSFLRLSSTYLQRRVADEQEACHDGPETGGRQLRRP